MNDSYVVACLITPMKSRHCIRVRSTGFLPCKREHAAAASALGPCERRVEGTTVSFFCFAHCTALLTQFFTLRTTKY